MITKQDELRQKASFVGVIFTIFLLCLLGISFIVYMYTILGVYFSTSKIILFTALIIGIVFLMIKRPKR